MTSYTPTASPVTSYTPISSPITQSYEGGQPTSYNLSPAAVSSPIQNTDNDVGRRSDQDASFIPDESLSKNKGGYPPFDPLGLKIGKYTDLDKIHESTAAPPLSDNPMDPNWGGTMYTKDAVDSGKYIENNVYPVSYSMPGGVQFYPGLHQTYPDPPNYTKTVGGAVPPFLQ
jgi:hypothetical protein